MVWCEQLIIVSNYVKKNCPETIVILKKFLQKLQKLGMTVTIKSMGTRRDETQPMKNKCYPTSIEIQGRDIDDYMTEVKFIT